MPKRTIKQAKVYRTAALEILKKAGARLDETENSMYLLDTNLGLLRLTVWNSSMMCRFEDVPRAKAHFGDYPNGKLNPFSGKWNWMGGMKHEGDMVDLEDFGHALGRILPESRTPNLTLPLVPYAG